MAWQPGVDEVDFAEYEVKIAQARAPISSNIKASNGTGGATGQPATPVGRILERTAGVGAGDPSASLASLPSLKVIALVSALRRELGLDLAAGDVVRCSTLAELERLCADAPVSSKGAAPAAAPTAAASAERNGKCVDTWALYAVPRFWKAPIGWLIRLEEVPDEAAMRTACRSLVCRHAGLRAAPYMPGDDAVSQLFNGAVTIMAFLRDLLGPCGGTGRGSLCARVAEGLLAGWPRVSCTPPAGDEPLAGPEEAHFEWQRFETEAELRRAAWLRARSRGFRLPASIGVLVLAGGAAGGGDAAFLHVAVNHAVTDAASIVPMVTDLIELHRAARATDTAGPPGAGVAGSADALARALAAMAAAELPPAPNGLEVQAARLRSALLAPGPDAAGSVGSGIDLTHNSFNPRRRGYDHYLRLMPGACRVLHVAAAVIGAPVDHILVALLAVAFGQVSSRAEVKLSLIVPMRDGHGDGQAVANLATTRHLSVWLGGGCSLLEVTLELSTRLRRREWGHCDVLGDDGDRFFINVRGIPGFEGAAPVMEAVDTARKPTRFVRNLVEMFADQEKADQWTFWMGIREDLNGRALSKAFRCALWGLVTSPLEPLGPAVM